MMDTCPEGSAALEIPDDVMIGEILRCVDCGAQLEVMGASPPRVELAPEEVEDWGE